MQSSHHPDHLIRAGMCPKRESRERRSLQFNKFDQAALSMVLPDMRISLDAEIQVEQRAELVARARDVEAREATLETEQAEMAAARDADCRFAQEVNRRDEGVRTREAAAELRGCQLAAQKANLEDLEADATQRLMQSEAKVSVFSVGWE